MDEGAGDGAMVAHPGQVHDEVPGSTATADHLALESALRAAVAERLGELRFSLWFGEDVHLGLSGDGDALGACPSIRLCSRIAPGFRWALAFSATAPRTARTIPPSTRRGATGAAPNLQKIVSQADQLPLG